MRALYFDGRELKLVDEYSLTRRGEALIKVSLAGICGTDLEILKGYGGFRGVLGHEFVGIVEESSNPALIGERVVGEINVGCNTCEFCRKGLMRHCPTRTVLGIRGRDGSFAEYLTLPEQNLHIVPDNVNDTQAVFTEPLAAAYEVLEQVQVEPSWKVAVLGDGRLGILIAQVLAPLVAQLDVYGRHDRKLDILRELGINALKEASNTASHSYDLVVEATGREKGFGQAVELVKPRGTVILKSTIAQTYQLDLSAAVVNEVRIVGSRCGPFKPALNALARNVVKVEKLVDDVYRLDSYENAFKQASSSETLKVLIKP
ncbi:MAG: alcohol dehydrogenase catalytic domain-containing protein [Candidatus Caldarchaeum sp.]